MLLRLARASPATIMRVMPLFIGMYDYIYKPYPEIIGIITREMGWAQKDEKFEHLDCEFHNIPFYIQSLKLRHITPETLHNSGLIRQGILSRDEALAADERLARCGPPKELETLLARMNMTEDEFIEAASTRDKTAFVPRRERMASGMYRKFILHDK